MSLRPCLSMRHCIQSESFVAKAVDAALKQSYRPLEIILSDDASTDPVHHVL